jgi:dipeptidyl-peptidase-4
MKSCFLLLAFALSQPFLLSAQEEITIDDYNRAIGFTYENYNNKKVSNLAIQPNWFSDSTGVWYIDQSLQNKRFLKITFPTLTKSDLFDHQKVAQILSDSLGIEINADEIPVDQIEYRNPTELLITAKGKTFVLNTTTSSLRPQQQVRNTKENENPSPDNSWVAYAKDYNLYLKSTRDEAVRQLSKSGKKGYEYATWYGWGDIMEGENGDRPNHFGVEWSANSEWISTSICDLRNATKMYLLDWSIDTLYRPKLLSYYRGSPGDITMVYMEPVFFNVATGNEIKVGLTRSTYINDVGMKWSKTPGKVFL